MKNNQFLKLKYDVNEKGFGVCRKVINLISLYDFCFWSKPKIDFPVRGHDVNGKYYPHYEPDIKWANYWTGPFNGHPVITEIRKITDKISLLFLKTPVMYNADMHVVTPYNRLIRPHVDTPYRFKPWNSDISKCLGIQVGIPLHQMEKGCGLTAFLPGSHKKVWDIDECYRGNFNNVFLEGCEQISADYGDVAVWDARVLHSQMPNLSESNRYLILINYLDESIIDDVMDYEYKINSGRFSD